MEWYWGIFYLVGLCGTSLPMVLLVRLVLSAVWHDRRDFTRPLLVDVPEGMPHRPNGGLLGRCARCGYLLIGLPEPRCPECGQHFECR